MAKIKRLGEFRRARGPKLRRAAFDQKPEQRRRVMGVELKRVGDIFCQQQMLFLNRGKFTQIGGALDPKPEKKYRDNCDDRERRGERIAQAILQ